MRGAEVTNTDHNLQETRRSPADGTDKYQPGSAAASPTHQLMMKMKILLLLLLLLAVCPCSHSSPAHYPTGKNRPCCLHISRKNLSSRIVGSVFHKQPARFPCVRAVIFYTKSGPICVHPNDAWVQQVIANITRKA